MQPWKIFALFAKVFNKPSLILWIHFAFRLLAYCGKLVGLLKVMIASIYRNLVFNNSKCLEWLVQVDSRNVLNDFRIILNHSKFVLIDFILNNFILNDFVLHGFKVTWKCEYFSIFIYWISNLVVILPNTIVALNSTQDY
jgi:hypothetical protein